MMGTNYYVEDDATCNNPAHAETLHIGKSSGGWKFGFHGIPDREPPLTSWKAWQEFLADRTITDEYGQTLTLDEFRDVVEKRYTPTGSAAPHCRVHPSTRTIAIGFGWRWSADDGNYHDADGFDFYNGEFS